MIAVKYTEDYSEISIRCGSFDETDGQAEEVVTKPSSVGSVPCKLDEEAMSESLARKRETNWESSDMEK